MHHPIHILVDNNRVQVLQVQHVGVAIRTLGEGMHSISTWAGWGGGGGGGGGEPMLRSRHTFRENLSCWPDNVRQDDIISSIAFPAKVFA